MWRPTGRLQGRKINSIISESKTVAVANLTLICIALTLAWVGRKGGYSGMKTPIPMLSVKRYMVR